MGCSPESSFARELRAAQETKKRRVKGRRLFHSRQGLQFLHPLFFQGDPLKERRISPQPEHLQYNQAHWHEFLVLARISSLPLKSSPYPERRKNRYHKTHQYNRQGLQ